MSKFIFLLIIISISAVCGLFIGQQSKSSASSETAVVENTKKLDFIKVLQNEKIINFQSFEDIGDEKELFGVVRQLDESCEKDSDLSSCQKFSVYDESGKSLYELKDFTIDSFRTERLIRRNAQIIIETNGGGTDNFLKILDYKDGKFTEIINSNETQMRGGFWSTPEYRIGGGDENPSATVFRFKDGKYLSVGEFKMQELGDFIEKQIAKKK